MTKPLLIEIAVEELPAIPFLKELPNIQTKWKKILEENNLLCEFDFYYTPRRLVFWHREFKIAQDDTVVEQLGAPLKIAYKDDKPTGAALGFAKKCGVDLSQISSIDKGKGEVLYYKQEVKGKESKVLLNDMVNKFIKSLNFGKSMKWGTNAESFIRPIRGLSIVLGDELVEASLYSIKSQKNSFAHRMVSYDKFNFDFAGDYFCKLDKNGVILYQDERRKIILDKMKQIEKENNFEIIIDEDLLDEIVAITEYPTALVGKFDEEFLKLPTEVIVGSMKEHQRYFEVFKDGKITNNFIVVSNAYTTDFSMIVAGNEKVLRPRLADAMFFYKNDIKNGLNNEGLKKITFVEGLGSLYEKCEREAKLVEQFANMFDMKDDKQLLQKAIMLSKSDLLTDMVYEFTNLQGLMGYYYAKLAGEDEKVYMAIKEQYLPNGENSDLPSSKFSAIVALANKIDTISSLFSIGMIPTGSRDPFALRRAASGIVKICIEHKLNLNIKTLFTDEIIEFFNERLYKIYSHINPSVIKAVLSTNESDILQIDSKLKALNPIVQSSSFKEYSTTFKRVANIIKELQLNQELDIDTSLFEDDAEKQLYSKYIEVVSKSYNSYDEQLEALFGLKPQLDKFFEDVFVNHENKSIKSNRHNLIGNVYKAFRQIADIKEITI
jgi:glycyl-tRNA synthetase beta chain